MAAPPQSPRILHLSQIIAKNTELISSFLVENHFPLPSDDVDSLYAYPEAVEPLRREVIEATMELQRLMEGPWEALRSWTVSRSHVGKKMTRRNKVDIQQWVNWSPVQAICEFDLARSFPVGDETSFADMSNISGIPESDIRRMIRYAITKGIFREGPTGIVRHTATSKMLAENETLRDLMDISFREILPAVGQTVNAIKRWPRSEEASHSGFALSQPSSSCFFSYLSTHPDRAVKFASSMASFNSRREYSLDHLITGYEWHRLGHATVVDIGGSTGFVSQALANKFPNISFVVQDTSETLAEATTELKTEKLQFMAHDFFTEQPVKNADVYFFRLVFHDYSDVDAQRILRQLIPALKRGAKVILNEHCLPEIGEMKPLEEIYLRRTDITMMALFRSRERDAAEWTALLEKSNEGFKLERITRPTRSNLSIIEVIWNPA